MTDSCASTSDSSFTTISEANDVNEESRTHLSSSDVFFEDQDNKRDVVTTPPCRESRASQTDECLDLKESRYEWLLV